jgi:amino acid transporter
MAVTDVGGEKRIFLRKASGLIRTAGTFDTFIYNIGLVSVGLGVGSILFYGPAYYPAGNMYWATIIAGFAMTMIAFGMICWTVTLPRSGGIYVFGSRSLPPFLAFGLSFVEITAWLFYCAIAAYWIILLAAAPALTVIGQITGSEAFTAAGAWLLEPWPMFLVGSAILILSGIVLASGMRVYLTTQKVVFACALIGSVILILVLAMYDRSDFVTAFNSLMTPILEVEEPYQAIIESGREAGWSTEGDSWTQTWLMSNWPFLPLIGAAFSIAIGGEVKAVERSQTYGMLGAIFGAVVIWIITMWLAINVFGWDFLGTSVYNLLEGVGISTPTDPAITLLAGILTNSPLVTVLVSLGLIFWMWMWIPGMHTFAVRAMVAWSFDRVAPEPLAHISERRHTPTVAIASAVIITIIFMALFVFTEFFKAIVILIEAAVLAWSIVLAAGIFFPYMRPDIYEKSPIANRTILGLPLMTVGCGLGFLAAQFYFWTLWSDPVAAGHDTNQLLTVVGVFAIGIIFYLTMKYIRASQGVDVTLAFKEIPIE